MLRLFQLEEDDPLCEKCKRYQRAASPRLTYEGKGKKKILIVSDYPSLIDDRKNSLMNDSFIKALEIKLLINGINLEKDCWFTNSVSCFSQKEPSLSQIDSCFPLLKKTISELKPDHIILLGGTPLNSWLRGYYPKRFKSSESKDTDIVKLWRGRKIPCPETNAFVYPIYHPRDLADEKNQFFDKFYERDVAAIFDEMDKGPEFTDWYKDNIDILYDYDEVIERLKDIQKNARYVVFDYEATGLKPYNKGHKIVTIGIDALDEQHDPIGNTISFPLSYRRHFTLTQKKDIRKEWVKILEDKYINKVAHHMKFENLWSRVILKAEIKKWHYCTMLGAYTLDERHKAQGLKFLAFVKYGVPDYDKTIGKYLPAETSNGFNTVEQAPLDDLLLYNAIDAKLTTRVFVDELKQLKTQRLKRTYGFLHKGSLALSELEIEGFPVDPDHFHKTNKEVAAKISKLQTELMTDKDIIEFEKQEKRQINLKSSKDMRKLLFDIKGISNDKKTKGGEDAVDKATLYEFDDPWCKKLLALRKYEKIKSTYVDQFIREISEDNKIHPFFHQHTTRTYRSSSSNPNSQNMPSRDDESKQFVKKGFVVPENEYFVEIDYGSIEVRIAACFTKDPVLIAYINDPSTDMHRDTAIDLYKLDKKLYKNPDYSKTLKMLRYHAKNGFIFPVFYGSYWRSCAKSLWKAANSFSFTEDYSVLDYLQEKDIGDYSSFEAHIKHTETQFWKKFHVFRKWQEESKQFYIDNGYVYSMFGARRRGLLNQNKILNTGIQGTGFQCLLWSLTNIIPELRKHKLQSRVMGQIHDSLLCRVHKDEVGETLQIITSIMEDRIRENCDWMVVPMIVEIESSELGGSWYDKKAIDHVKSIEQNKMVFV